MLEIGCCYKWTNPTGGYFKVLRDDPRYPNFFIIEMAPNTGSFSTYFVPKHLDLDKISEEEFTIAKMSGS